MGLGTRVYHYLFETSKFENLFLEVSALPPNPDSMRFHKRLGFKVIERHQHNRGYEVDFMKMVLNGKKVNSGKNKQKQAKE